MAINNSGLGEFLAQNVFCRTFCKTLLKISSMGESEVYVTYDLFPPILSVYLSRYNGVLGVLVPGYLETKPVLSSCYATRTSHIDFPGPMLAFR